jgi:hypothetical protein
MHEALVQRLPQGCRLTAMFDVSQISDIILLYGIRTDDVTAVLPFRDSFWYVFSWLPDHDLPSPRSSLYCM